MRNKTILIFLALILLLTARVLASGLPPIGTPVPPPPIDSSGNLVNPAADPGDNTDTGSCDDIYYFDDETGSDSNPCTSSGAPCKTADKWDDLAVGPGDCILYARGAVWNNDDPRFDDLPNGSAAGGYVTVGSYGTGNRPKFVFSSIHPTWRFTNKSYLAYERFETDGIWIWRINTGSHHMAWRYVRNYRPYDTCMTWRSGGSGHPRYMTLVGVACEDTFDGVDGCRNGETNGCGEGFYVGGNAVEFQGALDVHIQGCYTTNLFNESVSTKAQVRRVTVKGCLIQNNEMGDDPGILNCGNSDSDSAAILFDGNVVIDNGRDGGSHGALRLGRGCKAINNVVADNTNAWCVDGESTSEMYHNTCWSNDNGFRRDSGIPNANVKNNIGESASSISGNIDATSGLFEDTSTDDFRLKSGSAAIDLYSNCRGVTEDIFGTGRPIGSTCDAGAWEFDSGGGGDTTAPTVPTGLSATAASTSQINLSWTASTDAVGVTGYEIERCKGSGCLNFSQIDTSTTNSYNSVGLEPSTTYAYRVRAFDAAGNLSGYSNTDEAMTDASGTIIYKVLNTTSPTATGLQTITDSGFSGATPDLAYFVMAPVTALATDVSNAQVGIGWTDGNAQYLTQCVSVDNQMITDSRCMLNNDAVVGISNFASGVPDDICTASFDSFVAEGVKINWTTACDMAYQMIVILMSGVQAKAFDVTSPLTAVTQQVGTIGFPADVVWGLKTRVKTMGENVASMVMNFLMASDDTVDESLSASIGWKNGDNPSTVTAYVDGDSHFVCGETKCLDANPDHQLTTTTYSANGFDFVYTITDGNEVMPYLAIGQEIDNFTTEIITTPSSADAGATSYTLGFEPDFGFCVMTHLSATDSAVSSSDAGTQGVFFTDFTNTYSAIWGQSNNASPVQTFTGMYSGIRLHDSNGAALYQATITAEATGVSIDFSDNPAQADKWMCTFVGDATSAVAPSSTAADKDYVVISTTASGSTGTQTITSTDFNGQTPSMALFVMTSVTTLGTDVNGAQIGIGWSDGTDEYLTICSGEDNQGTTDNDCAAYEDGKVVGIADFSGAPGAEICTATFDSFTANSVTIDWGVTACPSAYQMIVVLGSNDVVNADAFKHTETGAASTNSYNGSSFEADFLYGIKTRESALDGSWSGPSLVMNHQFSKNADPDLNMSASFAYQNGLATSEATAFIDSGDITICGQTNCGSTTAVFDVDGYSGNGMDFVYASSDAADEHPYLALDHGTLDTYLSTIQTPSSADDGLTSYTLGFRPQFLMCVMSHLNTLDTLDETDLAATHGILLSDFENTYSAGITHSDGDATVQTSSFSDAGVVLRDGDGGALYQGTITDTSTGFAINFSDNPAQADYWVCFAVERGELPPTPEVTGVSGGTQIGGEMK